jgi:hypothetical protein
MLILKAVTLPWIYILVESEVYWFLCNTEMLKQAARKLFSSFLFIASNNGTKQIGFRIFLQVQISFFGLQSM